MAGTTWNTSPTIPYCLLYTSDAADDLLCVDLGGRRIIKKKNKKLNLFFFFKQKTAYEIMPSLVGSEMCIRDSPDIINNGWNYLEYITHDPICGNLKDRGVFILVNGDYDIRTLHSNKVLDSAADAAGDINFRPDSLAGLSNLAFSRHPTRFHNSARTTNYAAQLISKLLQHHEILTSLHTPAS